MYLGLFCFNFWQVFLLESGKIGIILSNFGLISANHGGELLKLLDSTWGAHNAPKILQLQSSQYHYTLLLILTKRKKKDTFLSKKW